MFCVQFLDYLKSLAASYRPTINLQISQTKIASRWSTKSDDLNIVKIDDTGGRGGDHLGPTAPRVHVRTAQLAGLQIIKSSGWRLQEPAPPNQLSVLPNQDDFDKEDYSVGCASSLISTIFSLSRVYRRDVPDANPWRISLQRRMECQGFHHLCFGASCNTSRSVSWSKGYARHAQNVSAIIFDGKLARVHWLYVSVSFI